MTQTIVKPEAFKSRKKDELGLCFQCFAAYNEGYHHFYWVNIDSLYIGFENDFDGFQDAWHECIDFVIKTSPVQGAEEILFTDHEGLQAIYSEYLDPKTVFDYLEQREQIQKEGFDPDLFAAWADSLGVDDKEDDAAQQFIDSYVGSYENGKEFAEALHEESGTLGQVEAISTELAYYIDFERVWSCSMRHSYHEVEHGGQSHFFTA